MRNLTRTDFFGYPLSLSPLLMDGFLEDVFPTNNAINGLEVSEDNKNVYISAAVPGIDPKDVDVAFDKGVITIRGEKKEEEKGKKFQRRATSSFFYQIMPQNIDMKKEPIAVYKNGVMTVTMQKPEGSKPKKIAVKTA